VASKSPTPCLETKGYGRWQYSIAKRIGDVAAMLTAAIKPEGSLRRPPLLVQDVGRHELSFHAGCSAGFAASAAPPRTRSAALAFTERD